MKSFSLSSAKWLIVPLITLAIIGVMWSYYAFIYVPARIAYFSGRNFRSLATVGTQITSTIENHNTKLRNEATKKQDTDSQTPDNSTSDTAKDEKVEIIHTFPAAELTTSWIVHYSVPGKAGMASEKNSFDELIGPRRREFDILLVAEREGRVFY